MDRKAFSRSLLHCALGASTLALASCTTTAPTVSMGMEDSPAYRSSEMNKAWNTLAAPSQLALPTAGAEKAELAPEVKAFRKLLKESDSGFVFENLYAQANETGQLYALSGLYLTNPVGYEQARKGLARKRSQQVAIRQGDNVSQQRIGEIIGSRGDSDLVIANGNLPNLLGGSLASSDEIRMQREIMAEAHPNAGGSGGGGSASTGSGGGAGLGELFSFSLPKAPQRPEADMASSEAGFAPSRGDRDAGAAGVALAGTDGGETRRLSAPRRPRGPGTLTASTADPAAAENVAAAAVAKFRSSTP